MTHDETATDDERTSDVSRAAGRRRFVQLSGAALAAGLAGCSDLGLDDEPDDGAVGSTPVNQATENGTEDAKQPGTGNGTGETNQSTGENGTGNGTEDGTEDQTATGTESEEGDLHAHGSLYLEIDGDRHPFTDPKYFQPGEHPDAEATDRFHFHDDGYDYRWHVHGERLTLADALGELPDIEYESMDGAHAIHFEGDTHVDGRNGTTVEIRQGETTVDSAEFELYDGDEIWIEITTGEGSD